MASSIRSDSPQANTPPRERERYFSYLNLNMNFTVNAWSAKPTRRWIATAHAIAMVTLIPFLLIASLEALVKNGSFLLVNLGLSIINRIYRALRPFKAIPLPPKPPTPLPAPPGAAPL